MIENNYDLEIKKMINDFQFEDYIMSNKSQQEPLGAWVIITDSQCVMGYNDYDGKGYHGDSIRKALCKILEEPRFSPMVTPSVSQKNYIIGIMMSSSNMTYLLFQLDRLEEVSPNQLKLLEAFKNQYKEVLEKRTQELGENVVIIGREGTEVSWNNLDLLYQYCSGIETENKILPPDINEVGQIKIEDLKVK